MRSNGKKLYHPETFANLLGDCHELEGQKELAQDAYESSHNMPINNAANHHIARLEENSCIGFIEAVQETVN